MTAAQAQTRAAVGDRGPTAARSRAPGLQQCLERKRRELALLNGCLSTPVVSLRADSVEAAVELKLRLAALLKADRLLERWTITETARPPGQWVRAEPFAFCYGYQRADLEVDGPSIYPFLQRLCPGCSASTLYTTSGMSAIATLIAATLQCNECIDIDAPRDCYSETRELFRTFHSRLRAATGSEPRSLARRAGSARLLWLDSSMRSGYDCALAAIEPGIDLVVLDTTCFWRSSVKIRRAVRAASRSNVPIALVRSHGKLDCFGIEYGRLGSVVLIAPPAARSRIGTLSARMCDMVRLLGSAPVLAHFPPFESIDGYHACSALRTASIMRSTRRIVRGIAAGWPPARLVTFQHALYLAIPARGDSALNEVRTAAGELATELAAHGLPVRHAGSFGFDFVAVEAWCDPDGRSALRVSGGDIAPELGEEIGRRIAAWLRGRRW